MPLPVELLESLKGLPGYDAEAFEAVHNDPAYPVSIRLNPLKLTAEDAAKLLPLQRRVPWTDSGYYLTERPSFTFDPLFHAGAYYVQEASSMLLEAAVQQLMPADESLRVLDLCAAPGGKSTHLLSLLSANSLLVSNEVIRSRAQVLRQNMMKWAFPNVLVTQQDPGRFQQLPGYFDLLVVDAPCSGSGLFRRDPELVVEWSQSAVTLCSQRQQRILADALPALKAGGYLIYSTCSYSVEEDEAVVNWLTQAMDLEIVNIATDPAWNLVATASGFRAWPHRLEGEGFFFCCLRKKGERFSNAIAEKVNISNRQKKEADRLKDWVKTEGYLFEEFAANIYARPAQLASEFEFIAERLPVIYSGIMIGEWIRDKLIPAPALALSTIIADPVNDIQLDRATAIRYLQRKELDIEPEKQGWQRVSYNSAGLGWVNVLKNRINNYYPKEWRILKDQP